MNQANAILGLLGETSLHAGAGRSTGVIDLPIQREGHNGWPCVFGSAVKGALRARAEEKGGLRKDTVVMVFGPEMTNTSDHAGALAVGDARLLLLPVRSLTTQFKWVTCPEALKRLKRDAERLGINAFAALDVLEVVDTTDQCLAYVPIQDGAVNLFLEEYRFTAEHAEWVTKFIPALVQIMARDDAETALQARLVVVSDTSFRYLSDHATPVVPHVRLDSEKKTVIRGALWYEETLPPETLLYSTLVANKDRRQGQRTLDADKVLEAVTKELFGDRPYLQLGGNETVGMGWCKVNVIKQEG